MSRVSLLLVAFVVLSGIPPSNAQVQGGPVPGIGVPGSPLGPPRQPPRDRPAPATGTALIRGAVVAADDSRPLRRAVVRVTAPELGEPRTTTTDISGRYEIRDLPAGRYVVTVSRSGFVTISHGQTRPNEMGRPIEVADGQTVERINFAMPRGSAITGRVVDEYGEPIAGASVMPMQMRFMDGRQQPSMVFGGGMSQTPDTGEFRLWGLAPGDYLIQVNVTGFGPGGPFESGDRAGYTTTYYPNATDAGQAQSVRVELGQTITGIEIVLSPTRTARITGRTMDSRGQPMRMGFILAMPQRSEPSFGMAMRPSQIKPDGTFVITDVTPGTYTLRATGPPAANATPEVLTATVTVGSEDVNDVVLTSLQPATITGRIVFDPPTQSLEASTLRVMATPKRTDAGIMAAMPMPGPPVVNDDFTFEVKTAPGEILLRALPMMPGDWAVKTVTHNGRDITEDGFEVTSASAVKDVEIVLTNRFQTISGVVTNERGDVRTDVTIFIFAQDRERWFARPPLITAATAVGRPDQNGRYSIRSRLRPGDYYAVAVEYLDQNRRTGDPAYLEELSRNAVRFTIREDETKAIDLRVARP